MDRPANYSHMDLGESILYFAATQQLHGLPYDYDSSASLDPQQSVRYAMQLCATPYSQILCTHGLLPGSHTWVDAVEMADAHKRIRW